MTKESQTGGESESSGSLNAKRRNSFIDKNVLKETFRIAAPAMFESFFSAVISFVDSKMVSALGTAAVASIAVTTQTLVLRITPFTALNVALTAFIARRKGEGKREDAHRYVATAFLATLILAVFITTVFTVFSEQIVRLSGSNSDTHEMAAIYFRILCLSTPFATFQNFVCASHRGAGSTKITLVTHLVANIVNVILNYLLIEGHFGFPALGVAGAAYATMIGSFVAAVIACISLFGKKSYISIYVIFRNKLKPRFIEFKNLMKIAWSVLVEQVLVRVGFILNNVITANLGTNALAVHRVAGNLSGLSFAFPEGLSVAAVALVGRSLGEGNPAKAKRYLFSTYLIGACGAALIMTIFAVFMRPIYGMFFTDPEVVDLGLTLTPLLITIVFSQFLMTINLGTLRASGDALFVTIISVILLSTMRPLMSYVFAYPLGLGVVGVWLSANIETLSRAMVSLVRILRGKWLKHKF